MAEHRPERPRLYTIAPTRPFLPSLVDALLGGRLIPGYRPADDPLALAEATILVPTRRSARALRAVFLDALDGRAAILPTIKPIGDVDEDALSVLDAAAGLGRDLDPEVNALERLLAMTRLVAGWSERMKALLENPVTGAPPSLPASPAEAVHLARALLTLMDQVETEGADWRRLADLVPAEHAQYWELTVRFLEIVTAAWPDFLAERGLVDPARRRNETIRREAERLKAAPPSGPVIAAGSTGSIPATADLLAVVARLERGAVVLPGLDLGMDEATWQAIGSPDDQANPPVAGHPQYGMKLLLRRFVASREEVSELVPEADPARALRTRTVAEALRPAATTDRWTDFVATADAGGATRLDAFAGVTLIEARHENEEALAIAVALREAVERPGATAALATPDRGLARRVCAELRRWNITVDDSAGVPLARTPPAVLARLVAETAAGGFDPVTVVSLLEHPLASFGLTRPDARRAGRNLELGVLRGPRPRRGARGLVEALDQARFEAQSDGHRAPRARRRLQNGDWEMAADLADELAAAIGPLEALVAAPGIRPMGAFLEAHVAALRQVARDETGADARLFEGEAGESLARMLAGLIDASRDGDFALEMTGADYAGFFAAAIGRQPVRRRGAEARVHVWGPLEARLQSVDLLVLGGLVEGGWPAQTMSDPWLSRPMKHDLGLEPPERRIGLAAHDFAQGLGAPRVVITRAIRAGGAPTVASRWLQRLLAVTGPPVEAAMRRRGDAILALARALDRPDGEKPKPVARPEPHPPVDRRPAALSVTEIETWIRDPYAIYARHVLDLHRIEPVAAAPHAGDRGSLVHAVLKRFVDGTPGRSAEDDFARFMQEAETELARIAAFPEVVALWRPRLKRIGTWFVGWHRGRAGTVSAILSETSGTMALPLPGRGFELRGRADRIESLAAGGLAVVDYKTGTPPSAKQVAALLAPQLPLEAAMAKAGAFGQDLAAQAPAELVYLHLSGSGDGGRCIVLADDTTDKTADVLADEARDKLQHMAAHYQNVRVGYPSRPRIQFAKRMGGDYDHLARVKEWAAGEAEGDGE